MALNGHNRNMSFPLRSFVLATLCVSLTACGSTVQVVGSSTPIGQELGGSSSTGREVSIDPSTGAVVSSRTGAAAAGGGAGNSFGSGSPTGAIGTPPSAGPNVTGNTGTGSGTGTGAGPETGSSGQNGPGVTDKAVYVGLIFDKNAGAINNAVGAGGLSSGNSKDDETAVIDDINKSGGVGGRKLIAVYAEIDSTSSQTLDQQYAAVCQKFTQDQPRVFAVAGPGPASYLKCITEAGLPLLDDDLPRLGAADFARYPTVLEQGYANVDRLAAYHVAPLVAQKYFTPWNSTTGQPAPTGPVKVGLLTYNDTVFSHAVNTYVIPALKNQGYDPVVVQIAQNTTASDIGAQSAAVQSAQLTFASRGVTHVIIFEANAGLSQFFLADARSQQYYPRYGINSANGPQALLTAGLMTKQQANGAVGYGWLPNFDLDPSFNSDNGPYATPLRRKCAEVMKSHGISFTSSNAQGIGYIACTNLYLLKAGLDKIPRHITLGTFISAVEGLGTSFQPAGGLGSRSQSFQAGRHDPQDRAYFLSYFPNCGCFHYSGEIQTIP